jgi:hypothetical protein
MDLVLHTTARIYYTHLIHILHVPYTHSSHILHAFFTHPARNRHAPCTHPSRTCTHLALICHASALTSMYLHGSHASAYVLHASPLQLHACLHASITHQYLFVCGNCSKQATGTKTEMHQSQKISDSHFVLGIKNHLPVVRQNGHCKRYLSRPSVTKSLTL